MATDNFMQIGRQTKSYSQNYSQLRLFFIYPRQDF